MVICESNTNEQKKYMCLIWTKLKGETAKYILETVIFYFQE
jgi:hypothetical protein